MGAGTQTLKRTPLHDRHVAARRAARAVRGLGDARPVRAASARSTWPSGGAPACSTSRTWARSRPRGPEAEALLQRLLTNDVARIAVGGAQYALLCTEDGGVLDDLFTYRLAPDRFLTVTNAANHARDLAWFRRHAEGRDVAVADRIADFAMLAVQGPEARGVARGARRRRAAGPLRHRGAHGGRRARRARVRHGLHGRGRRGAARPARAGPPRCGTRVCAAGVRARRARRARHAAPRGLLPPLRQRPVGGPRADRGRASGWCCKEDTGFIGAEAVARVRAAGPAEKLVPFALTGPGIARQGNPVRGRRRRHLGHAVAVPRVRGRAWPTCPPSAPSPARRSRSTCAASRARPRSAADPSTARRPDPWPRRATRRTSSTTPSTTGRASTATSRRAGSPGTRRSSSARSSSSTRRRSARRSPRTGRTPRWSPSRPCRT